MPSERLELEVSVLPDAGTIAMTQRVVENLSRRLLHDDDVGWRLAMATHELLDNARKYGHGEIARVRLAIEPASVGHTAHIRVQSRSSPPEIGVLEQVFADIRDATDAQAYYHDALRRVSGRDRDESGLGLARLWAEGDMALSVTVDDGYVEVNASLTVGA